MLSVLSVFAGLVLLVGGAELLVRGAAAIAGRFGVSPLLIGLTVVAFGTSAPELAVSINAAAVGSDVGLGNVIGSNIANVLLILGATALVGGLVVALRIIRLDIPLLIGVSVLVLLLALDGAIGRVDGAILVAGLVAYGVWTVVAARRERVAVQAEYAEELREREGLDARRPVAVNTVLVLAGLGLLVGGAQLLVGGATRIATALGVSDLIIGLTVVAIGTSLPELATSVLAALRGERDIAIGNVVGSSIINLLCVLGLSAIVAPSGLPVTDGVRTLDLPVMVAATITLLPVCWNGLRIRRWEGALFLAAYAVYVLYLVLSAAEHAAADVVAPAALIAAPLVIATLAVLGFQGWRRVRRDGDLAAGRS